MVVLYMMECHPCCHHPAYASSFCLRGVVSVLVAKGSEDSKVVFTSAEKWKGEREKEMRRGEMLAARCSIH